jgi:hypothetical protein
LAVSGAGVLSPGPTSDRIVDPEVVQNILTHNQGSTMGGKRVGSIARWELPLPVYLEPQLESERGYVIQALDYLQANAGITYTFVSANTDPRVTVTTGSLGGNAGAQGGINSVFSNNQARRGTITIGTQNVPCPSGDCMNMYRHEFFHVLGINGHLSYPPQVVYVPGGFYPFKELAVLRSLYSLPHGATVNPDGTWR